MKQYNTILLKQDTKTIIEDLRGGEPLTLQSLKTLISMEIINLRIDNDTANGEESLLNRGGIRELMKILSLLP